MKQGIQIIAVICLFALQAAPLQPSWAAAHTREWSSSSQQKCSLDRPAEAEVVFGKDGRYSAVLLCCWRILVCEQQGDRRVPIWDWDKFDGGEGFKDDFLVRDVDGDGSEEVAFQIGKMSFCFLENAAALYSPEKRILDNKLYVLTDNGLLSCYNARTGAPYYQQVRLPKTCSFRSSPVGVNGKLYLASENEDVVVLGMGEKYEALAVNTMPDEVFIATPAITGGEIFLRSQKRIYCIHE